jgi:CubicO group peptidase (beta-lactamase class C family)
MNKKYLLLIGLFSIMNAVCIADGDGRKPEPRAAVTSCSITELEDALDSVLAATKSKVDFSFAAERWDGRRYRYQRGASTLRTSYKSASTSKLVSAVVILRLVERGYLKLSDRPQEHIAGWPINRADPLFEMTLAQLLSFTSGLVDEPLCLNRPGFDFERCVIRIAEANAGEGGVPGTDFFYAGTHLQVAGLMAVKARGLPGWAELFAEFKLQTGLFPNADYDLPSVSNPRLAGGMHWTGEEYLDFLGALKRGALLNADLMRALLTDHTAGAAISYSPTVRGLGEEWRYGFGLWHECESPIFNCLPGVRISSPGAYGAYPFWDRGKDYAGIVAQQGRLGTFPDGVAIERSVRSLVEKWGACDE